MRSESIDRQSLYQWMVLALALGCLYSQVIANLVKHWLHDPNYSHGFLVPLLAGYAAWNRRHNLLAQEIRPANLGLLAIIGGVAILFLGTLAAELFVTRASLIVVAGGLVLYLAGWGWLRGLAFPLTLLLLMIPIPQIIFNQVAFPLQLIGSRFASMCLSASGVPVLQEGNLIVLPNMTLEVVDACSGIRSLLALITVGVAYSYYWERNNWIRVTLVAATIPIAVAASGLRLTVTGLLTYFVGAKSAQGFFHYFEGWLVFLFAVGLLVGLHWSMRATRKWWQRGQECPGIA